MRQDPSPATLPAAVEHLTRDVIYAWRGLWRERAFALTTVTTLAVALALVTVVFTIFNAYVLRPYAVRDPYSLHEIRWRSQGGSGRMFRWSDYEELRSQRAVFDDVIAERNRSLMWEGRRLLAGFVSGNYFESLGGRIHLGRPLAEFDASAPGASPVAVLSYQAWQALFDGDSAALGREIRLNDQTLTVVGIMDEQFTGMNDAPPDLWIPITMHGPLIKQDMFGANQPREVALIGRLKKGVGPAQAEAALTPLMPQLVERSDAVRAEILPQATPAPLSLELIAVLSPVFAAFLLVLAAASANVSNVMLARANARQREIGIRLSVGASRGRVVRQLMTEGLLIAALAGIVALALASLVLRTGLSIFFLALPPAAAAVARLVPLDFDHRVFLFTFAVAGATTIMFALLPALHATRLTLTDALRGELGPVLKGSRLRSILVIGQVAVSLVLLVAAATLLRNGAAVRSTDLGLDTRGVISVNRTARGPDLISRAAALLATEARVEQVAVTSRNPLQGELPKLPLRTATASNVVVTSYMFVSPEYFPAVHIPILHGRTFTGDEAKSEAKVGIVSAAAARRLWPGEHPIGKVIQVWIPPETRPDLMTRRDLVSTDEIARVSTPYVIVGVAGDVVSGLIYEGRDFAHLYLPTNPEGAHARSILVRPRSVQDLRPEQLQMLLLKVHPNLLAFEAFMLEDAVAIQMFPLTVASWIGLLLSGIAVVLSVSGLYGVVTYSLSQRTKEIGIRIALGATSSAVVRLLVTQSARLVTIGGGIGLFVSFAAMATLRSFVRLENVSVLDAGAFAASAAIIGAAAGFATYYPARRAAHIEPSQTLRADQ